MLEVASDTAACMLATETWEGQRVGTIISTFVAVIVGGTIGAVTVVGVVNSQTAAPDKSPTSVNSPAIEYGSNN